VLVRLEEVEELDDTGMIDTAHDLDLFEDVGALCNTRSPFLEVLVEVLVAILRRVELILAHDLDGNFATSLALDGLVHVGEGAVAHLFDKLV